MFSLLGAVIVGLVIWGGNMVSFYVDFVSVLELRHLSGLLYSFLFYI